MHHPTVHHHLKRWMLLHYLGYWVQMVLLGLGLEENHYPTVHCLEVEDWKSSWMQRTDVTSLVWQHSEEYLQHISVQMQADQILLLTTC